MTRRDWELVDAKMVREDWRCRCCKSAREVQRAHIIGREHDRYHLDGTRQSKPWVVYPERIIPLCSRCHLAFDSHQLDLLPYLKPKEQAQAVQDAGGIENARIRTCPSAYQGKVAA